MRSKSSHGPSQDKLSMDKPPMDKFTKRLAQLSDAAYLSVIFIGPLFMGGRHPLGRYVLCLLISIAVGMWLVEQCFKAPWQRAWQPLGAAWMALAAVALVFIQILPMPGNWISRFSPGVMELLPAWETSAHGTRWSTLSLTPEGTRSGLAMACGYALFFLLTWQRLWNRDQFTRHMRWIIGGTLWLAAIGILQLLSTNGKFLWIYEHPTRDTLQVTKGPFQNQNHFGTMMVLGLGPMLWWVARSLLERRESQERSMLSASKSRTFYDRGERRAERSSSKNPWGATESVFNWLVPAIATLVVALAGFLTFSRGAMIAMITCASIALLLYSQRKMIPSFVLLTMLGGGFIVGVLGINASKELWKAKIIQTLDSDDLSSLSPARFQLWQADWKIHQAFPWFGTGVGSHRYAYRVHHPVFEETDSAYAESSVIHILVETGWIGIGLTLLAVLWSIISCVKVWLDQDSELIAIAVACASGLIACSLQALADFVWQIPACTICLLCLLAMLWRLPVVGQMQAAAQQQLAAPTSQVMLPPALLSAAFCVLVIPWSLSILWPEARSAFHWDHYLRLSRADVLASNAGKLQSGNLDETHFAEKLEALAEAVRIDTKNPRLHERLMLMRLSSLEAKHGPIQIWCTMLEALPDEEARKKWLKDNLGDHCRELMLVQKHVDRTLRAAPLSGRAYVVHANLRRLLKGGPDAAYARLLKQAECVRSNDPYVLLNLGITASIEGKLGEALQYWGRASACDETDRYQATQMLVRIFPASQVLSELKPNSLVALRMLNLYRANQDEASLAEVGQYCSNLLLDELNKTKDPYRAYELWTTRARVQEQIEDDRGACVSLAKAVSLQPTNFDLRFRLAQAAFRCQHYGEAVKQVQWCLRRRPDDLALRETLRAYTQAASRVPVDQQITTRPNEESKR